MTTAGLTLIVLGLASLFAATALAALRAEAAEAEDTDALDETFFIALPFVVGAGASAVVGGIGLLLLLADVVA